MSATEVIGSILSLCLSECVRLSLLLQLNHFKILRLVWEYKFSEHTHVKCMSASFSVVSRTPTPDL